MLDRRLFLFSAAALAACGPSEAASPAEAKFAGSPFRKIADAEWKKRLSPLAYKILRHEDTERPGSSPLNAEKRRGTFVCAGCGLPLFKSQWKFESGTGWPSFFQVMKENIGTKKDLVMFIPRTEYRCARCLGHQGHVFDDGPRPTGLRYCNNGAALRFIPLPEGEGGARSAANGRVRVYALAGEVPKPSSSHVLWTRAPPSPSGRRDQLRTRT